jgi:phosphatidylserine/phosphatidylglycerophosphate/cardiolipin synthase-like enzyme
MKKIILILSTFFLFSTNLFAQTISIAAARAQAAGNIVTVSGIATNGAELGTIRYIQDGTGGIAVYSALLGSVNRGDIITVTATIVDYNNLLELNPVSSFTVNSTGNPMPVPIFLTPNQIGEPDESELVQISNVIFTNGGVFAGNTTYAFTANGENGIVYLNSASLLAGQTIPAVPVTLTAICSQYQSNYQLIPRDANDIVPGANFYIVDQPVQNNISTSGFDVNWATNLAASTYIEYGHTPALELGTLNGAGGSANHTVNISGANASDLFYVKAYSVSGTDTAISGTKIFITASNSTGTIKTYFDRSVNNSVANPPSNLAIQLNNHFADTLAAYMDRSQASIDIAIYNFDSFNTSVISQAINNAYNRGVSIRIIADGNNSNSALALLNAAIPIVYSPTLNSYWNIMHNKFVVIDADVFDANLPVVWTGSTNWSDEQLNTDANNVIIFQDQSLAKAYTMEFNEMWGSSTNIPDPLNQKFGPDKTDNTPHEFLIGGKRVENYFSPSDNVNNQILGAIQTADNELYFSMFVFTRTDVATAIDDRISNHGVYAAGLVDDTSAGGQSAFSIMQTEMGNRVMEYDHLSLPGILHHKYMIVDQSNLSSDPLVLTGSHNWSSTANLKNDENTVIVHDPLIANQYYQEFYQRFTDNGGGILGTENNMNTPLNYSIYPNPCTDGTNIFFDSKKPFTLTIQLFDLQGKLLIDKIIKIDSNTSFVSLPLHDFSNGLYFLELSAENFSVNRKLVIER